MNEQELVAKYSDNYLWCELVPHYQKNPEEFEEVHGGQSDFPDEITDESIEEFFRNNINEQSYEQEMHHDDFKISVNEEFRKYIGARCKLSLIHI